MNIKSFDRTKNWNSDIVRISVEEFDSLEENHIFSEDYERKKQKVLAGLQQGNSAGHRNPRYKAVAALALIFMIGSTTVYAASSGHLDIFDSLWGNSTKENVPVHDVEIEGNEGPVTVTLPSREYVSVDEKQADRVFQDRIMDTPIVKPIGDHTLTIESVVYDKNGAVIYYTLEREGGVTMLAGDDSTNQSKGACFTEETPYYFYFGGAELTYIDLEKSTKDKLYCCAYQVAWGDLSESIVPELTIMEYGANIKETISITDKDPLDVYEYVSKHNGSLEISAIDISIDLTGHVADANIASIDYLKSVEIRYKDGTDYLVYDKENYVDNTGYLCGGLDDRARIAFNRLVDTDAIDTILVNGVEYRVNEEK